MSRKKIARLHDLNRRRNRLSRQACRGQASRAHASGKSDAYRKEAAEFAVRGGLRVTADLPKPIRIAQLREVLTNIKSGLFNSLLEQFRSKPHA